MGRPPVEDKKKMQGFALRPEVIDRLKEAAKRRDQSISSLAGLLLAKGLDALDLGID